jgi:Cu/Ag efflux protein CusF
MDSPERAGTPTPNPLDAERARLRKEGFTDHQIRQILLAREFAAPQATGGASQGVMTGVLSNLSAVLSHARGILPSFKTDLADSFDRAASPPVRVRAAGYLALMAAVIVVLAYAVKQEWQQHIISATEIAASQAEKTAAEAEIQKIDAKIKKATDDTPMPEITTPAKDFFAVRKPTTAGK